MSGLNQHMRFLLRNIILYIFAAVLIAAFPSCGLNNEPNNGYGEKDRCYLKFSISPVATRSLSGAEHERIKSLRIIILDKKGDKIECNHYVSLQDEGKRAVLASDLIYEYTWPTTPGTKKIYVIANEESVGELSFQPPQDVTLNSEIISETSLKSILDSETNSMSAIDFGNIMNSVYFNPEYIPDSNGDYFITYVSEYDNIKVGDFKDENSSEPAEVMKNIYLVPVSAKFIFNFINNRDYTVNINEISVINLNSENFLFARIGDLDYTKTLPEQTTPLYWIDWLAEVSRLSQAESSYYPNLNFNAKYGWITDYALPEEKLPEQYYFFIFEGMSKYGVAGVVDNETEGESGTLTLGPFYVAESNNYYDPESGETMENQGYFLNVVFEDTAPNKEAAEFKNVKMSNLNALFRNTNVIVTLTLEQGYVEVYAEIADWNVNSVNGYLTEGGVPGSNPFN